MCPFSYTLYQYHPQAQGQVHQVQKNFAEHGEHTPPPPYPSAYMTGPRFLVQLDQGFWGQMDYFTPNWRNFSLFIDLNEIWTKEVQAVIQALAP